MVVAAQARDDGGRATKHKLYGFVLLEQALDGFRYCSQHLASRRTCRRQHHADVLVALHILRSWQL